ncbi:hypothetical protein D3C81_1712020 [compost metagenome]
MKRCYFLAFDMSRIVYHQILQRRLHFQIRIPDQKIKLGMTKPFLPLHFVIIVNHVRKLMTSQKMLDIPVCRILIDPDP